jgi:hypothetical protein
MKVAGWKGATARGHAKNGRNMTQTGAGRQEATLSKIMERKASLALPFWPVLMAANHNKPIDQPITVNPPI